MPQDARRARRENRHVHPLHDSPSSLPDTRPGPPPVLLRENSGYRHALASVSMQHLRCRQQERPSRPLRLVPLLARATPHKQSGPEHPGRPVRTTLEEPRIPWHHRIGDHVARIIKMDQLPVLCTLSRFTREVRPDPSRAPHLRILFLRLPCFRRSAKAPAVGGRKAHLLGMTIGATILAIKDLAVLFLGRQANAHSGGCCLDDFSV